MGRDRNKIGLIIHYIWIGRGQVSRGEGQVWRGEGHVWKGVVVRYMEGRGWVIRCVGA